LSSLWTDLLGIPKVGSYTSEKENVDEDILITGHGPHAVEIDLMQPLDPSRPPKVVGQAVFACS
jgi:lactoylglutathione lyase